MFSSHEKTENLLFKKLINDIPTLITQYKAEWCKNKTYLPFDFCIPEHNIIIELDGNQHFVQISNWSSPEHQLKNDLSKQEKANQNEFSMIRLLQNDVMRDKCNWYEDLLKNIQTIIDEKRVQNIYMCKNNEYVNYINTSCS
jgi:very-short-patch-repair endonuclease